MIQHKLKSKGSYNNPNYESSWGININHKYDRILIQLNEDDGINYEQVRLIFTKDEATRFLDKLKTSVEKLKFQE
jgi:uncharacterized lipoprotein YehR (DUF1307 family)